MSVSLSISYFPVIQSVPERAHTRRPIQFSLQETGKPQCGGDPPCWTVAHGFSSSSVSLYFLDKTFKVRALFPNTLNINFAIIP
jgi:hypothetical protein